MCAPVAGPPWRERYGGRRRSLRRMTGRWATPVPPPLAAPHPSPPSAGAGGSGRPGRSLPPSLVPIRLSSARVIPARPLRPSELSRRSICHADSYSGSSRKNRARGLPRGPGADRHRLHAERAGEQSLAPTPAAASRAMTDRITPPHAGHLRPCFTGSRQGPKSFTWHPEGDLPGRGRFVSVTSNRDPALPRSPGWAGTPIDVTERKVPPRGAPKDPPERWLRPMPFTARGYSSFRRMFTTRPAAPAAATRKQRMAKPG